MIAVARGRHVIFGTGPVGVALARALEQSGRTVVSVPVNEYGSDPFGIAVMRGDATDFEFAMRACQGASVIYSCLNGPVKEWDSQFPPVVDNLIRIASETGAKLVHWDLAHMYGPTRDPIAESTPNAAKSGPSKVLIDIADKIVDATWTGRINGVIGRSADIYGPGAIGPEFGASFGGRVFWPAHEDADITIVGDIDAPRSLAFIDDVASGLVMLGESHDSTGHIWHLPCAPPLSPAEMAANVVSQARSSAEIGSSPRHVRGCALLQLKIVRADISEVQHELHALDRPFVLDHSKFTAAYGEQVTDHDIAIKRTLAWFFAHPRPISDPIVERVAARLPEMPKLPKMPRIAATSRLARRFGSGALGLAKTSL